MSPARRPRNEAIHRRRHAPLRTVAAACVPDPPIWAAQERGVGAALAAHNRMICVRQAAPGQLGGWFRGESRLLEHQPLRLAELLSGICGASHPPRGYHNSLPWSRRSRGAWAHRR